MPDADSETDVLIVGAGPVGLMLACELQRLGVRFRIVDAESGPTPAEQSRGLGIHARTLEMLARLDLADDLVARGRCVRTVNVWDHGRRFARFDLDFAHLDTPFPFVLVVAQGETERLLIERLAAHGIPVEWNIRLVDLRQDSGRVTASLQNGDGNTYELHAAWLVGCDGAHSTVRRRLDLTFDGFPYEERFLLADVRMAWDLPPDELHLMLTAAGPVAAVPLPEPGLWRLIDTTGSNTPDNPAAIADRFRELLAGAKITATIESTAWASAFRIHRRATEQLRVGRCFLAGDAAHIHSPVGGQGMNTGMQDASNLAWKLALVLEDAAPESLLDSYEAERLPVAAAVVRGTHWATRIVLMRNRLARAVRNRFVAWLTRRPLLRRRLTRELSELGVGYRGSPIVAEDVHGTWGGPQPGDRVPDVEVESTAGPLRLSRLLGDGRFVLLAFAGLDAPAGEAMPWFDGIADVVGHGWKTRIDLWRVAHPSVTSAERESQHGLIDREGRLHRLFAAESACLSLIRPDGYVGYRGRPPDAAKLRLFLERRLKT